MKTSLQLSFLIISTLLCAGTTSAGAGDCDVSAGWFEVPGIGCYLVSEEQTYTFDSAQEFCTQAGGYQVEIDDQDEQDALRGIFQSDGSLHSYWTGLNDKAQEGVFVWEHSGKEAEFTSWYPGEPSQGGDGNCVFLGNGVADYDWVNVYCDFEHNNALCEKDIMV